MSFGRDIIVFFLKMYINKMVKVGIVAIVGVEATKSGALVASLEAISSKLYSTTLNVGVATTCKNASGM
jgi:hypothetical protein